MNRLKRFGSNLRTSFWFVPTLMVALALSLPIGPQRDLVPAPTYAVVVFSIVVQGLSVGKVVRPQCR